MTGAGDRAFCTGADLDEQARMGATSGQYWRWMGAFIEMHDRLRHIGKPTIARINGICVGGGNELQMACDLSVHRRRRVHPARRAGARIGAGRRRDAVAAAHRRRPAGARDHHALRAGPAGPGARVGPRVARRGTRDELDAGVAELAAKLARKLPEAMRYTKTQLNWWRDLVWSQTVEHARDWLAVHSTADETREAVAAFHDKRGPRFAELRRLEAGDGRACPACGAVGLPAAHRFCGACGVELPDSWDVR